MPEMTFNTTAGAVVARKLLILLLNTGTSSTPVWSPVGKRVEDSSEEYDWGEESKRDIFGNVYTTLNAPIITQTFEPWELDSGDAAQQRVWNINVKDQDTMQIANQDLLVVHAYAGTAGTATFAERYPSSMVKISGLGGSASVGMPIDVTFGGERVTGAAAISSGTVTFTPDNGSSQGGGSPQGGD